MQFSDLRPTLLSAPSFNCIQPDVKARPSECGGCQLNDFATMGVFRTPSLNRQSSLDSSFTTTRWVWLGQSDTQPLLHQSTLNQNSYR